MGWGAHGWNGNDGPNPFCAWSLKELGWLGLNNERLVEVDGDLTRLRIEDLHAGGTVYQLPLKTVSGFGSSIEREYLLLEQRQRASTYYHRDLPAEGLLVWHIRSNANGKNRDEAYKLVDLISADGLFLDAGYPLGQLADGIGGWDNLDFWAHDKEYTRVHNGNLGDATDPFDGRVFRRLDLDTNPSNNPQWTVSAASTGLQLELQPEGQAMVADITQPRWAGTITEEVHWSGTVLVDGDLTIAPQGRVVLHKDTRVRFAGQDRLQSGLDPDRCELTIKGDLILSPDIERAVFEAMVAAEDWYCIVFDPADSSRVKMKEGQYVLHNDLHGFVFPGALSEVPELVLQRAYQLHDEPQLATAGLSGGRKTGVVVWWRYGHAGFGGVPFIFGARRPAVGGFR
jgi:hypothetical protein